MPFYLSPIFLLCGVVGAEGGERSARPCVLFLVADDLNTQLGCYGNSLVKTPAIDRLARRGMRFDRAYCQYPLCNPSRCSFFTGLYPPFTKVVTNDQYLRDELPNVVTLPQSFREAGFDTIQFGKVFHDDREDLRSWSLLDPRYLRRIKKFHLRAASHLELPEEERRAGLAVVEFEQSTAAMAVRMIRKDLAKAKRPWFLAVGFHKPHTPLVAPPEFEKLYDPEQIPLPEDLADVPTDPLAARRTIRPNNELFVGRKSTPDLARRAIADYYSAISFVDAQIGRVLDAMEESPWNDQTIIVLVGDNGFHLGEKGLWGKFTLLENATRVPLIIRVPSRVLYPGDEDAAGFVTGECTRPVELIDLYPTLSQLCGVPVLTDQHGQSLVPLLKNPEAEWNYPAITFCRNDVGRSIRTERYRYTEYVAGSEIERELYDYENDPREQKNLAGQTDMAEIETALRTALHDHYFKLGMTIPNGGDHPKANPKARGEPSSSGAASKAPGEPR